MEKLFAFTEYLMVILAAVIMVAQGINHSAPGFFGFMLITYVLIKQIRLERR